MDGPIARGGIAPPIVDDAALMMAPHEELAGLRPHHAVVRAGSQHLMVLRAGDVAEMLSDRQTRQIEGAEFVAVHQVPEGVTARFLTEVLLFANGAAHRARRGLFARAFAHAAIRAAENDIRGVARRIVRELPRGGRSFDFVEHMAGRVPAEMIAALLGLPASEAPWFASRVYRLSPALGALYPHDRHAEIETAARELYAYIDKHLTARWAAPRDDLLSRLLAHWHSEELISYESLVFQVMGVVIGGSDTTRAGFAMLVALLLRDRESWATLRADRTLIPSAVAEGLRYEPPVASIVRVTTSPVELGGHALPPGSVLRLSTLSALRDPEAFDNPDIFDIRRIPPRLHPVFGFGPHRCLGEMLARLEMELSLEALLEAGPDLVLERMPKMEGFGGIRQISPMPVRIP